MDCTYVAQLRHASFSGIYLSYFFKWNYSWVLIWVILFSSLCIHKEKAIKNLVGKWVKTATIWQSLQFRSPLHVLLLFWRHFNAVFIPRQRQRAAQTGYYRMRCKNLKSEKVQMGRIYTEEILLSQDKDPKYTFLWACAAIYWMINWNDGRYERQCTAEVEVIEVTMSFFHRKGFLSKTHSYSSDENIRSRLRLAGE